MDKKEFMIIIRAIRSAYPTATMPSDAESMELWYRMLKDIPYENVSLALEKYILTSKWPPAIADLRSGATQTRSESLPDWSDEWGNVMLAVRKYGYPNEAEALESMTPLTRQIVKQLGWRQICESSLSEITAIRANFRMIYERKLQQAEEDMLLPQSLKEKIQSITNGDERLIDKGML